MNSLLLKKKNKKNPFSYIYRFNGKFKKIKKLKHDPLKSIACFMNEKHTSASSGSTVKKNARTAKKNLRIKNGKHDKNVHQIQNTHMPCRREVKHINH